MTDLLIHYGWGLFATLNPCVLPILPFVILSALDVNRLGPLSLSAGLLSAYTVVNGTLALVFGAIASEISETYVASLSAFILMAMGFLFLVPRYYTAFTGFLSHFSSGFQQTASDIRGSTLREQFFIGFLLALAWIPCSSPAIIASSSSTTVSHVPFWFTYVRYVFFGLGAITFVLVLGLGTRGALMARRNAISSWTYRLKPFVGGLLIVMGTLILTGGVQWLETHLNGSWGRLLGGFDTWLQNRQEDTMGTANKRVPEVRF